MQDQAEKKVFVPRTPQQSVDRMLPLEEECISCHHWTAARQEVIYDNWSWPDEPAIFAKYKCKCGYEQGLRVTGRFVDWWLTHFRGVVDYGGIA